MTLPSSSSSAVSYNEREQRVIVGTVDGLFSLASMKYSAVGDGEKRKITLLGSTPNRSSPSGHGARQSSPLALAMPATESSLLSCRRSTGKSSFTVTLANQRSLMGGGNSKWTEPYEISSMLTGQPVQVLVPATADAVIVLNNDGSVNYLFLKPRNSRFARPSLRLRMRKIQPSQ